MTFIIGFGEFWSSTTADGILGLFGSVIGVIGAFLVASYQLKSERRKEKENQKPIVKVTSSSEFISFEPPNDPSITIKLVNAGDTAALNVSVTISTFARRIFWGKCEDLTLDTIFKKKYSVLMGGDSLDVPIITNLDDAIKTSDSNVMPIDISMLLSKWKSMNGITFFINVSYSDRENNNFSENQAVTLSWSRVKYTDESFKTAQYANYSIQEGCSIDTNIFSVSEFNKAVGIWNQQNSKK